MQWVTLETYKWRETENKWGMWLKDTKLNVHEGETKGKLQSEVSIPMPFTLQRAEQHHK